jgi:hypothetical protein
MGYLPKAIYDLLGMTKNKENSLAGYTYCLGLDGSASWHIA